MIIQLELFIFIIIINKNCANDQLLSKIDEYNDFCMKQSHVNPASIEAVKNHHFDDNDAKLKEHGYCFAKKLNFLNDDGGLQVDVIRAKLTDKLKSTKIADRLVNRCVRTRETGQETAYYLLKCLHINVPRGMDFVN
uniref:OBP1 n=1 Tax=Hycleus phaleratus TaxID=1248972 RepID=A0A2U9NJJ8_9CUCU|nr:OBP1 [Hycleus phaleratus]